MPRVPDHVEPSPDPRPDPARVTRAVAPVPHAPDAPALPTAAAVLAQFASLESRLAELERDLARSHRLATLGMMVATIAHEVNNLLTPVLSYAQMARARPDDPALVAKALDRAAAGAEGAAKITASILAMARGDGPDACFLVADVAAALSEARSCLARDPAQDGISLAYLGPIGAAAAIRPIALQQVLLNLILNGLRAVGNRPGSLVIETTAVGGHDAPDRSTWNTPHGRLVIRVRDTGGGIPAAIAPRLFTPFATHTSEGARGTGLGLSICQRLVEEVGGTIAVESTSPAGTTIRVELARAPSAGRAVA